MKQNEFFKKSVESLSDRQLHEKMVSTAEKEREFAAEMLSLIAEVAKRKSFLDLGFGSLFDYLTIGLKYSAAAAQRRIAAARIVEQVPEVKEQVLSGKLNLSTLSQADRFFRIEEKVLKGSKVSNKEEDVGPGPSSLDLEGKKKILNQLEGLSSREAEKTLIQMSSVPVEIQREKVKLVTPEISRITLNADTEFMELLEESKGLLGHQMPGASVSEVLAEMMRRGLKQLKKERFKVGVKENEKIQKGSHENGPEKKGEIRKEGERVVECKNTSDVGTEDASRHIPNAVKRAVYERDQGRCVVLNPRTGKPCGSRAFLEYDHFPVPLGKGGASTVKNLRISCRACNLLHAVQSYGRKKAVTEAPTLPRRK